MWEAMYFVMDFDTQDMNKAIDQTVHYNVTLLAILIYGKQGHL